MKQAIYRISIFFAAVLSLAAVQHIVVDGDTLWDLAQKFYNNPYEWSRIWSANPYINNPDLIYPDDRVVIPGIAPNRVEETKVADTQVAEPISFSQKVGDLFDKEILEADSTPESSGSPQLHNFPFITKQTLIRTPFTWQGEHNRRDPQVGLARVNGGNRRIYRQHQTLSATLSSPNALQAGDTILFASNPQRAKDHRGQRTSLFIPTGIGRVVESSGDNAKIEVEAVWGIINESNRAFPLPQTESFPSSPYSFERAASAEAGLLFNANEKELLHPFSNHIIDLGKNNSIEMGDIFFAYTEGSGKPVGEAVVILSQESSATLTFTRVFNNARPAELSFIRKGRVKF